MSEWLQSPVYRTLLFFVLLSPALEAANPADRDVDFGDGGQLATQIGAVSTSCKAACLQTDGKILLLGENFTVMRLNADGTLDSNFGVGGAVKAKFDGLANHARALVIQSDGKILAAGSANAYVVYNSGTSKLPSFALARWNADGTVDETFGTMGEVVTPGGSNSAINGLAVGLDGMIVAAGQFYYSFHNAALVRYSSDGKLDLTFGTNGRQYSRVDADECFYSVALQTDGKIVAAGAGYGRFMVARFFPNGDPDYTFTSPASLPWETGYIILDGYGEARGIAIQRNGKIVVNGMKIYGNFQIARFEQTGDLDESFGQGGIATTDFLGFQNAALALTIQPDGKLLAAGYAANGILGGYVDVPNPSRSLFAIARYLPDGRLDSSFGDDGKITELLNGENSYAVGVAFQSDNKLLVAGTVEGNPFKAALIRYVGDRHQPDLVVAAGKHQPAGEGIFNVTAESQTLKSKPQLGLSRSVSITIKNSGNTDDSFHVKCTPSGRKIGIRFFNGLVEVTDDVVAGTFQSDVLAQGTALILTAKVSAKTRLPNQKRLFMIEATSSADESSRDVAAISVVTQ